MKIIVTRNTFVAGKVFEVSPDPVEVADAIAKQLIAIGKALSVPTEKPAPDAQAEPVVAAETPAEKTVARKGKS